MAQQFFAVDPKRDCPHLQHCLADMLEFELDDPCGTCSDKSENWVCVTCSEVYCSRYVNSHMVAHYEQKKAQRDPVAAAAAASAVRHCIGVSFSDGSVWCFECDSYITHPTLRPILEAIHLRKFGKPLPQAGGSNGSGARVGVPEDTTEFEDSEAVLQQKARDLADMISVSNHLVIYTGAGISTSAQIPDYRGPNGVWTLRDKGEAPEFKVTLEQALPTRGHMAIKALVDAGICKYVVSTNVDGLHRRSGLTREQMAELHGNIYREVCWSCHKEYLRHYDTTSSRNGEAKGPDHRTGRKCECGQDLRDSIIHFGENLPVKELEPSIEHSNVADVALVLGTSMRVTPACDLPLANRRGALVICNLQKTPKDDLAALRIFGRTDRLLELVCQHLGVAIPDFSLDNDPVVKQTARE